MQYTLPLEQRQQRVADVLRMLDRWLLRGPAREEFAAFVAGFYGGFEIQSGGHSLEKVRSLVSQEAALQSHLVSLEAFLAGIGAAVFERFRDEHVRELNYEHVEYFRSLAGSTMSIFRVLNVTPLSHVVVKDVVFDTGPHRVREVLGTTWMEVGGYFAGRLLDLETVPRFSGGFVPLADRSAQALRQGISDGCRAAALSLTADEQADPDALRQVKLEVLSELPATVAGTYLLNHANLPATNSEKLIHVRIPVLGGSKHVQTALSGAADFVWDGDHWLWIPASSQKPTVEAELFLEQEELLARVPSNRELKSLRTRLRRLLGDRLGNPQRLP